TCTGNSLLVFRRQLVHTQNRDNVAQFLVALQCLLNATGNLIMLFANDLRVELTAGGVERVNGRVNTQRSNVTRQHDGGVEVKEGRCGRRVGQVIGGNVHSLDRSDRASLGGRNTLLQLTHFFCQRRLITHGGRHTTQQSGHFGTGQGVAVDVVDEEQDVTAFVTELLGHGQARKCDAQTVAGRFVHLTEHHGHLRLLELVELNHAGFGHFVIEVVAFASTLTHTRKHRQTTVSLGNVVDEFKHVHGLAHTGTAEQTDLTALRERADQVNNLDAGFEQLNRGRQFVELGSFLVNGAGFGTVDGTTFVDGATQDVHDAAQRGHADRHRDGSAGVGHGHATTQTVGGTHGDGANRAVAQLLLDLE